MFDIVQGFKDSRVKFIVGNLVKKARSLCRWRHVCQLDVSCRALGNRMSYSPSHSRASRAEFTCPLFLLLLTLCTGCLVAVQEDVEKAVKGIDAIYHVAAPHASHPKKVRNPADVHGSMAMTCGVRQ